MPSPTTRSLASAFAAAAVMLAVAAPVVARPPDRIDLPLDWQPEGVTAVDDQLFVGSLNGGAIWQADATTGVGSILVPDLEGTVAVGVEAEATNGRLWVAGGRTGEVRAYDIESGELLKTYAFKAGFINDLVATPEAIYATDSFMPQILVIPLRPDGGLRDPKQVSTLDLSGDLVYEEGSFNLNGIVATPAGLVVVQSEPGALFLADPTNGVTTAIDTGEVDLLWGDGLELDGRTLYVVRNRFETIAALELDETAKTARLLAELTSDDLDVPATAAITPDGLWAANARFGTPDSPQNEFWLTRFDVSGIAALPWVSPVPSLAASPAASSTPGTTEHARWSSQWPGPSAVP